MNAKIETKITSKMSFEEYWSKNKAKLMNTKYSSEMIAQQIWGDCVEINVVKVDGWGKIINNDNI